MMDDPICSMFIGYAHRNQVSHAQSMRLATAHVVVVVVVVIDSVYALMKESMGVLMQWIPSQLDHTLPGSFSKVRALTSVLLFLISLLITSLY